MSNNYKLFWLEKWKKQNCKGQSEISLFFLFTKTFIHIFYALGYCKYLLLCRCLSLIPTSALPIPNVGDIWISRRQVSTLCRLEDCMRLQIKKVLLRQRHTEIILSEHFMKCSFRGISWNMKYSHEILLH